MNKKDVNDYGWLVVRWLGLMLTICFICYISPYIWGGGIKAVLGPFKEYLDDILRSVIYEG